MTCPALLIAPMVVVYLRFGLNLWHNNQFSFGLKDVIMDFFIQNAWAGAAPPSADAGMINLVMLLVLFVVFYFLLIRPQTKRAKEHRQMVDSLAKGDEIVTNGGVLGRITNIGDNFIVLEIAANTEVKVQRQSVAAVMPKGTMKNTL